MKTMTMAVVVMCIAAASANGAVLIGEGVQNGDFELPATGKIQISTGQIPYWTVWAEVSGASNDTGIDQGGGGHPSRIMFIQPQAAVKNMTGHIIMPGDVFTYGLDNILTDRAAVELSLIYQDGTTHIAIPGSTVTLSPVGTIEATFTAAAGAAYIGKPVGLGIYSTGNWPEVDNALLAVQDRKQASMPTPADGAVNAGELYDTEHASVVLKWKPGVDPEFPDEPYSLIRTYYVYISRDQRLYNDPNLYYAGIIDAGYPEIALESQYPADPLTNPLLVNLDGEYLWRVDTGIAQGGGVTGPDDPNTLFGRVWRFNVIKSVAQILEQPGNVLVDAAGDTGVFELEASTVTPGMYQWYRHPSIMPVFDEQTGAMVPAGSPVGFIGIVFPFVGPATLTVNNVQPADQGFYYCKVWNLSGEQYAVYSNAARLGIKQHLAHWTLDGLVGNKYADETGNFPADPNNPGAVLFVDGIHGNAVKMDGNAVAQAAGTLDPSLYTDQITLSAWIRVTGNLPNVDGHGIISKRLDGDGTQWRWSFYARGRDSDNARSVRLQTWNGGDAWSAANSVPENEWTHVAAVVGGDGVGRIYVNGVQSGNTDSNWIWGPMADAPVTLGGWTPTTSTFPGDIDDIQIWNYGKDKYGIADLYYAGTGNRICTDPLPAEVAMLDVNNDCIVDIRDFAILAASWMDCGRYPDCK